jgi:hypothetical protein
VPDDPIAPEPLRKSEPVVVGDIVDLVVVLAGVAGVMIPDDVAAKVVAAVAALVVWLQSTYFKRKSVTPVDRAGEREAEAYDLGVAQGEANTPGHATVFQVVDRIADPPPPPPAAGLEHDRVLPRDPIPWAATRVPPPGGLDG